MNKNDNETRRENYKKNTLETDDEFEKRSLIQNTIISI